MYDGTYWVWISGGYDANDNTIVYSSAWSGTAAATAAKTATCYYYTATANSYLHIIFRYANSYHGAITLNVDSKGAKPVYINGAASSSTNYTLPAGSYICFYDGTNYYFRTDGYLPGPNGTAFTGTNGSTAGTAGLVPAPTTSDTNKYLKSDGTWATVGASGNYVLKTGDTMTGNLVTTGLSVGLGLTNIGGHQIVGGHYNIADTQVPGGAGNNLALIIGNGHGDETLSNAHTLDWNGNAWFAGDVYVHSTSGTNKDAGSKKLATEYEAGTGITISDNTISNNNIYSLNDITPGETPLEEGRLYFVYE